MERRKREIRNEKERKGNRRKRGGRGEEEKMKDRKE